MESGYCRLFGAVCLLTATAASDATLAQARCANGNDHIQVELYMRRKCPECVNVRIFFLRKRLTPIERSIDEFYWLHDLRVKTGQDEAPTVYACGTWIFGFDNPEAMRDLHGLYNVRSANID